MKLKCVIVDDEPLAREGLAKYVEVIDYLELIGMADNPLELEKLLESETIDLIFLDIQMPFMSGIDFLRIKSSLPMIILTTAFSKYALDGFQFDVVDYLLKPITFNRFFKATNKAKELYGLKNPLSVSKSEIYEPNFFFIKCDSKYEKIYFNEILYVQSLQNYVIIFTEKGKFMTLLPLKTVEENLDKIQFIKVHKSYLVATQKIEAIENNEIIIQNNRIPISRNFREEVLDKVLKDRLLKK
jgi:DNA-binding LytR/AlgR family response regulator